MYSALNRLDFKFLVIMQVKDAWTHYESLSVHCVPLLVEKT